MVLSVRDDSDEKRHQRARTALWLSAIAFALFLGALTLGFSFFWNETLHTFNNPVSSFFVSESSESEERSRDEGGTGDGRHEAPEELSSLEFSDLPESVELRDGLFRDSGTSFGDTLPSPRDGVVAFMTEADDYRIAWLYHSSLRDVTPVAHSDSYEFLFGAWRNDGSYFDIMKYDRDELTHLVIVDARSDGGVVEDRNTVIDLSQEERSVERIGWLGELMCLEINDTERCYSVGGEEVFE